jgi:hypothetical protein
MVLPINQNRDFTYIKLIYWYAYFHSITIKQPYSFCCLP